MSRKIAWWVSARLFIKRTIVRSFLSFPDSQQQCYDFDHGNKILLTGPKKQSNKLCHKDTQYILYIIHYCLPERSINAIYKNVERRICQKARCLRCLRSANPIVGKGSTGKCLFLLLFKISIGRCSLSLTEFRLSYIFLVYYGWCIPQEKMAKAKVRFFSRAWFIEWIYFSVGIWNLNSPAKEFVWWSPLNVLLYTASTEPPSFR